MLEAPPIMPRAWRVARRTSAVSLAVRASITPRAAAGRLYFFSQEGKAFVIKPGRAFALLATNTLPAGFMASPAVDGNALILRTKTDLYRIEAVE